MTSSCTFTSTPTQMKLYTTTIGDGPPVTQHGFLFTENTTGEVFLNDTLISLQLSKELQSGLKRQTEKALRSTVVTNGYLRVDGKKLTDDIDESRKEGIIILFQIRISRRGPSCEVLTQENVTPLRIHKESDFCKSIIFMIREGESLTVHQSLSHKFFFTCNNGEIRIYDHSNSKSLFPEQPQILEVAESNKPREKEGLWRTIFGFRRKLRSPKGNGKVSAQP